MRYSEIMELFDGGVAWTRTKDNGDLKYYEFQIGETRYVCHLRHGNTMFDDDHYLPIWDIDFDVMDRKDNNDFMLTGGGNAITVFSTVMAIAKSFAKENNFPNMRFMADVTEPSRVKLYKRMISSIKLPPYETSVKNHGKTVAHLLINPEIKPVKYD